MSSPTIDIKRGKEGLIYFHNRAMRYPWNYHRSFEELCSYLQAKSGNVFLEGFGFAINQAGMDDGQVREAMEKLADAGTGNLPTNFHAFFQALQGTATQVSFLTAIYETAKGTVETIADQAKKTGESVIGTLDSARTILPYIPFIVVGIGALVLYQRAKSL